MLWPDFVWADIGELALSLFLVVAQLSWLMQQVLKLTVFYVYPKRNMSLRLQIESIISILSGLIHYVLCIKINCFIDNMKYTPAIS